MLIIRSVDGAFSLTKKAEKAILKAGYEFDDYCDFFNYEWRTSEIAMKAMEKIGLDKCSDTCNFVFTEIPDDATDWMIVPEEVSNDSPERVIYVQDGYLHIAE